MVNITNRHNLPEAMVRALTPDYRPKSTERIGVTDLIGPPRIRELTRRHYDDIEVDVSDNLWALLGSAAHVVMEKGGGLHEETELWLESTETEPMQVVGVLDSYDPETATIRDWKVTSVFSFLLGDKPEWEAQLNVYAHLMRERGFPVDRLEIHAILRDWQGAKAKTDPNYPNVPFKAKAIPLWEPNEAKVFIRLRQFTHSLAILCEDDELPFCTPEERWERPTTYAVKSRGRKSAHRVLDTYEAAESWMADNGKGDSIEVRTGESVRCANYCPVARFCNQWAEIQADTAAREAA